MKKLFITFAIIITSLSGFSQSFSVDSKSMSVPRYANQAAITAAIAAPVEGMLVYNNALDQFAYYVSTTTGWVNFPSAGGPPPSTTSVAIPTYANITVINAIPSPPVGMLVFNLATNGVVYRNASSWTALSSTPTPWVTSGDNIAYVGTGKILTWGLTSFPFAGAVATFNTDGTDLAPSMLVQSTAGNKNVIRYDGGNNAQEQVFTHSSVPADAKMEWNVRRLVAPGINVANILQLSGRGDLTTPNATAFGEIKTGNPYSPGLFTKVLTGTTSASLGDNIITHGVPAARVVDIKAYVFDSASGVYATRSDVFSIIFDGNIINLKTIGAAYTSENYIIYITFID